MNRQLLDVAVSFARAAGAEVDVADSSALELPPFNADLPLPEAAQKLSARLRAANGLLLATLRDVGGPPDVRARERRHGLRAGRLIRRPAAG